MQLLRILFACLTLLATTSARGGDFVYAEMKTNYGLIVLQLDTIKAPISVANFVEYAKAGFYTNTVFHRVIPTFMIQGGGFDHHGNYPGGLHQKPGTKAGIKNEWENGLKNTRGTIAMARTSDPNSATSQFFINTQDNPALDQPRGGAAYAVFGTVIAGMDTVDAIKNVQTTRLQNGMSDVPVTEVRIETVTIVSQEKANTAEARIISDEIKLIASKIEEWEAKIVVLQAKLEAISASAKEKSQ